MDFSIFHNFSLPFLVGTAPTPSYWDTLPQSRSDFSHLSPSALRFFALFLSNMHPFSFVGIYFTSYALLFFAGYAKMYPNLLYPVQVSNKMIYEVNLFGNGKNCLCLPV